MAAATQITPYKRGHYPTIEGNDRVFFDDEFRKLEQTIGQIIDAIKLNTYSATISGGVITLPDSPHLLTLVTVDTESAAATDDLDTINCTQFGKVILVETVDDARDVTLTDGTGNLKLKGANFALHNHHHKIMLVYNTDGHWCEISRSDNS